MQRPGFQLCFPFFMELPLIQRIVVLSVSQHTTLHNTNYVFTTIGNILQNVLVSLCSNKY